MEAIKRSYRNDVWTAPSSSEIPACWMLEYAGPQENPAQGKCGPVLWPDLPVRQ